MERLESPVGVQDLREEGVLGLLGDELRPVVGARAARGAAVRAPRAAVEAARVARGARPARLRPVPPRDCAGAAPAFVADVGGAVGDQDRGVRAPALELGVPLQLERGAEVVHDRGARRRALGGVLQERLGEVHRGHRRRAAERVGPAVEITRLGQTSLIRVPVELERGLDGGHVLGVVGVDLRDQLALLVEVPDGLGGHAEVGDEVDLRRVDQEPPVHVLGGLPDDVQRRLGHGPAADPGAVDVVDVGPGGLVRHVHEVARLRQPRCCRGRTEAPGRAAARGR